MGAARHEPPTFIIHIKSLFQEAPRPQGQIFSPPPLSTGHPLLAQTVPARMAWPWPPHQQLYSQPVVPPSSPCDDGPASSRPPRQDVSPAGRSLHAGGRHRVGPLGPWTQEHRGRRDQERLLLRLGVERIQHADQGPDHHGGAVADGPRQQHQPEQAAGSAAKSCVGYSGSRTTSANVSR